MLANALAAVALLALVATTVLSAGLCMTRAAIHRIALLWVAPGYQAGLAALEQTVASDLRAGPLPSPFPSLRPVVLSCDGACRFVTSANVKVTGVWPADLHASTCVATESNCALNEERNFYVGEGRVTARVIVQVATLDGTALARRTGDVILRTFRTPPYVALSGARDATIDESEPGSAAGDDGGATMTRVRVVLRNAETHALTDACAWTSTPYSSPRDGPTGWSP